jgi:glycine/D-amino acid oxidase-like deaminating enzyme
MKLDVLIVGHGIAGTIASCQLISKGYTVGIIDKATINQSSKLASAIINPLSGKKWHQVAQFDKFLSDSLLYYKGIEKILNQSILQTKNHI